MVPTTLRLFRAHMILCQFLFRCTSGMVVENQYGCIMADEMGLGKTLQCIALLWTLVKQSPHAGKPTIEKCIIACPSSLVKNWANELGRSSSGLYVRGWSDSRHAQSNGSARTLSLLLRSTAKGAKANFSKEWLAGLRPAGAMSHSRVWPASLADRATASLNMSIVMIVSYETLRSLTVYLTGCKIGLLLCDEGHRLKNAGGLPSFTYSFGR